jgi:hypothetical protein
MCIGLYQQLRQYHEDKEWHLMELAAALSSRGWYAAVTWHKGKLMLVVRSQRTMENRRKWKRRATH